MSGVDIDPKILSDLSAYIGEIHNRTQTNVADVRRKGEQTLDMVSAEVRKRQIRVEELRRRLEACLRSEDADCGELRRLLTRATLSLDAAQNARRKALTALSDYKAKSEGVEDRLSSLTSAGKNTIRKLQSRLDDYSAFTGLVAAAALGAAAGIAAGIGAGDSAGGLGGNAAKGRSLSVTGQSYVKDKIGGMDVLVFDHPKESAKGAVFNQGSARPVSYKGTCGLCATGSISVKAGVSASEESQIAYASNNGLCAKYVSPERNGGTSAAQLVSILAGASGVDSNAECGEPMAGLAAAVEKGQGVIIGVDPSILNPAWYGAYNPNNAGGHWVVLESVIRDPSTNAVIGYAIIDSNGASPDEACQFILASKLEAAYSMNGGVSVVTNDVIW